MNAIPRNRFAVLLRLGAPVIAALCATPAVAGYPADDMAISMTGSPATVAAGADVTYTITVTNTDATNTAYVLHMFDTVPVHTTFTSLSGSVGWTCSTPAVGAGGTVDCTMPTMAPAANSTFTLVVNVDPLVAPSTPLSNTATIQSGNDPNPLNDSATVGTTAPVSLQTFDVE